MEADIQAKGVIKRPIIAILTMEDTHLDFRGNRDNFIDLISSGKELGLLVYVTTAKYLKIYNRSIIGYSYNEQSKKWTRLWMPVPQIVYNRIPNREDEMKKEVKQAIHDCLRHPNVHLFNPFFFNKWHMFEWLYQSRTTSRFIPFTRRYSDELDLSSMLRIYPFLFLKPEQGKAGQGIMKIKKLPSSSEFRYRLTIQDKKNSSIFHYKKLSSLKQKLLQSMNDEKYIVQQGIVLAKNNRRPFDLRALIQKNRKGLWAITGVGARLAGESSITTHVPRGGSIEDPRVLLGHSFGKLKAKMMMNKVKKTAVLLAEQIEEASGYQLGEMSMDLGMDKNGHLWFFEANAKPMKFDEPHIRKKSLSRILQYSSFLYAQNRK